MAKKPTEEKKQEVSDTRAMLIFKRKFESAMEKVSDYKKLEEVEAMFHEVIQTGRQLADPKQPLDMWTPDRLLRVGGRMAGAYGYLGQRAAFARTERDMAEQKVSEVEKELFLEYRKTDSGYKVTEIRAKVADDVQELREFVIQKEATKNQWEAIVEACQMIVMYTQSAIRWKEGERYQSSRTQNN